MPDNTASALCYVLGLLTGILFLVLEPYNKKKNIRFHAFQSIFLHVGTIVVWIALRIVFGIMANMGLWMILTITPIIWLAFMIFWIMMIVWAYQGKTVVIPIIGPLAQQQA
jgi:uncharacterized membrane protein